MIQSSYNLSTKQKKEIFSKYSKQINYDFYYTTLDDIIDYRDNLISKEEYYKQQEHDDLKSLLKKIITQ